MARRTGRSAVSGTTLEQPRARVRDMSGGAARVDVQFDARTAYDFVVSVNIAAGDDADLLPEGAAWLARARKSLPDLAQRELSACFGEGSVGLFHALPSVIVGEPGVTDAAGFLERLRNIPSEELTRLFLADVLRHAGGLDLIDPLMAGDADARRRLGELAGDAKAAEVVALLEASDERIESMRGVLDTWLPLYQEVEDRVARMLERDVDARRREADKVNGDGDVPALIERITGGLRWFPEAGVRRVILAPSYFARPYNYIYQGSDWRLFAYPLADAALGALDPSVPPQAVVRLYRALGDPTRMRVLRLLGDRDWYLTELAQQLELSKPTMKHHLAMLRAAGLVTVTEQGGMTYYTLRRERLAEAGVELQRYLG
jgi:DNA-binding transcriptional ArsR family regulator